MVSLAEDLTSPDQMRGARAALQEFANDTADHLALLIQTTEQLKSHKLAMEKWMTENEKHVWFTLENYVGLLWSNTDRTDGWPNYEYHEYQTIQSAMNSEEDTIKWEMTQVRRLIPQFWAYAQVLSRAWYLYTDGLHESEDELNQTVSKQIHDVCQMIKTAGEENADLVPVDYLDWYAFMKGWIEDFKRTRTSVLETRAEADAAAATIAAGTEGQSEVVGAIPAAEPSSAVPSQSDATVGDIPAGASDDSMPKELQDFRDQKRREREQNEAWARIHGVSPPEDSTKVKKSTHRFEQWLERQLKANRETLAQSGDFALNENYFKSDADKAENNQSFGGSSSRGLVPNEAWYVMKNGPHSWISGAEWKFHIYVRRVVQISLPH